MTDILNRLWLDFPGEFLFVVAIFLIGFIVGKWKYEN